MGLVPHVGAPGAQCGAGTRVVTTDAASERSSPVQASRSEPGTRGAAPLTTVLTLDEIKALVDIPTLVDDLAEGFVAYSRGEAHVPPVGFLHLDDPPGDVHIKYGYIAGNDVYVLKVASAFYRNPDLDLPANGGVFLVFSARTGAVEFVLLDEGWLTDIRTAAAGAVAARVLANSAVDTIGIVGTGVQARLQLELLRGVVDARRCLVWGRNPDRASSLVDAMWGSDLMGTWVLDLSATDDLDELVAESTLIVTTTSATTPLITAEQVNPGTHITAMGSDDHGKQELAAELLARADRVVADSVAQCVDHGECHAAVQAGLVEEADLLELGQVIENPALGRTAAEQITIADLTGVAVQDIQVARMVANAWRKRHGQGPDA